MIKMKTSDMIALSHILDKFKKFDSDLNKLIVDYSFSDFSYFLNKVMNDEESHDYRYILVKKFYKKYCNIINTINIYTNIEEFINTYYIGLNPSIRGDIILTYEELVKYKELEPFIIKLLERIQSLGIEYVSLNPSLASEQEKSMDINYQNNENIDYLSNTSLYEIDDNKIYYKSLNTLYIIHFNGEHSEIELQSLLLNINSLPESISKEEAFTSIFMNAKKIDKDKVFKQYEKLHVCVADLYRKFLEPMNAINSLDRVEDINKIRQVLSDLKSDLFALTKVSQESTNKACASDEELEKSLRRMN